MNELSSKRYEVAKGNEKEEKKKRKFLSKEKKN